MSENFLLDTMTWSFSRINYTCLLEFYLHYIECNSGGDNFFGQYGIFAHSILEKYAKGELGIFDLSLYYEDHFDDEVWMDAPYTKNGDLKEKYFFLGKEYFDSFDFDLSPFDVLGIEKEVKFQVGRHEMIGYIDLLLREKETGKIIILDHKSHSLAYTSKGALSKSKKNLEAIEGFKRQLYLYSIPVIEEYGKLDELWWNLFKDRKWLKLPWLSSEFEEAKQWAIERISNLYDRDDWTPIEKAGDDYYCRNLCGQREICEYCRRGYEEGEFNYETDCALV